MIILDANVLLYGFVPTFAQHVAAKEWIEKSLTEGRDSIGITWQVATAFLRISTNPRVFKIPFEIRVAKESLGSLLSHPMVELAGPTKKHWEIYSRILVEQNITGDVVMDAHITAVAIEHNAAVASTDKHFRRFSDLVKIIDPLKKKK